MSFRRYLVLIAVAAFAASGDVCLARGMRETRANYTGVDPRVPPALTLHAGSHTAPPSPAEGLTYRDPTALA